MMCPKNDTTDLFWVPYLSNSYISSIEDILCGHKLSVLLHADDLQLYVTPKPSLKEEATLQLEACFSDTRVRISVNKLICNSTKTKFIFFEPQSRT